MNQVVLDDHLLRDLLVDDVPTELGEILETHAPATTNHYLYRLSRSVVSSAGGALTGSWTEEQRHALGLRLVDLPAKVMVVPMRTLAFRMAEIAAARRVSTLGAEAIAAAENLGAPLCVWSGDDGPAIRSAMAEIEGDYRSIER